MTSLYRDKYRVESTRLKGWDYAADGWYFVTICTRGRECFFGKIVDQRMQVSPGGITAADLEGGSIEQHGIDFNGNGVYDFSAGVSSLDPSLPFEATVPAVCGELASITGTVSPTASPTATATATATALPRSGGSPLVLPVILVASLALMASGVGALGLLRRRGW